MHESVSRAGGVSCSDVIAACRPESRWVSEQKPKTNAWERVKEDEASNLWLFHTARLDEKIRPSERIIKSAG